MFGDQKFALFYENCISPLGLSQSYMERQGYGRFSNLNVARTEWNVPNLKGLMGHVRFWLDLFKLWCSRVNGC